MGEARVWPIVMPDLGAIAEEATLVAWLVREGDRVTVGQPIFEVESDKARVAVEAVRAGLVRRLLAADGEVVSIGATIGELEVQED
jgi:pyruvate/2-oxoglutarate dehydrogenase complex dihydrolipoamide acyltransferase (E2) component